MAKTYRPYVPEQDLLLPPSLREWLPEDYLYHPVMLTKIPRSTAHCVTCFLRGERSYNK